MLLLKQRFFIGTEWKKVLWIIKVFFTLWHHCDNPLFGTFILSGTIIAMLINLFSHFYHRNNICYFGVNCLSWYIFVRAYVLVKNLVQLVIEYSS